MRSSLYFLLPQIALGASVAIRSGTRRAAYFLDNNPAGCSIVSLEISEDQGTLSNPVRTSTGGIGLFGNTTADPLFSQDAILLSQDYLFAVNPGSHTLSMLFVDKYDPQHPTLIGTPADTLGEYPVSVAYSTHLKTACVLNGGAKAGVTCFSTDHKKGLQALGGIRPIALGQTTPPVGPPNTVSDIVFNPSQTALVVTVKGNGVDPGYIYTWPVEQGAVSVTPIVSRVSGIFINFSIDFLGSDSSAMITDPTYGAAIVSVTPDHQYTLTHKVTIPNQAATCWGAFGPRFDTAYAMDGGGVDITMVDPYSGAIKGQIAGDPAQKGSFDTKVDRTYLYSLAGSPSIAVFDVNTRNGPPKHIQTCDLSALGSRSGWTGMAVYPSS